MMPADRPSNDGSSRLVRSPKTLLGGLVLVAIAAVAVWMTLDLDQGTLSAMGPGMLPRWLAIAVGACGIALIVAGVAKSGDGLAGLHPRGPVFVLIAILAFAATIRPLHVGELTTPGLGLLVAGPLAILIGGFATPEARLKELVVLALGLTAFCMVLFGDLLNLPIPVYPRAMADQFPADWSQKLILRVTAGVLAVAAVLIGLAGRHASSRRVQIASGGHDE